MYKLKYKNVHVHSWHKKSNVTCYIFNILCNETRYATKSFATLKGRHLVSLLMCTSDIHCRPDNTYAGACLDDFCVYALR